MVGKTNKSYVKYLKSSLDCLVFYLGLVVNNSKSIIYCFDKISSSHLMEKILCIKVGYFLLTYLGLHLTIGSLKSIHFQSLFDRLYAQLVGQKRKFLSLEGRFQFLRSTINKFLTYWFIYIFILKRILKNINSLIVKFFYHVEDVKKLQLVSQTITTLHIFKGGMGLQYVHSLNTICKVKTPSKVLQYKNLHDMWCLQIQLYLKDISLKRLSSLERTKELCYLV